MSDLPVADLLSVQQAIAILDSVPITPRMVQLPLLNALNLRLAEDIFSDRDYPPFHKAVMDGFAVRSIDTSAGNATLNVIDTVAAGQVGHRQIGAGEAAAIMTGAPISPGADAVVPVEQTTRNGLKVIIHQPVKPGQAIARQGSDTSADRLLLTKGTKLGPAQIAVAANVGRAMVCVYAAPRVTLLSTGNELVEIDQMPTGAQIRNSNGIMLESLLVKLGCEVTNRGIERDDRDLLRAAIQDGLQSDALFISGGMSMGERDYIPGLLEELGLDLRIRKLRIKPGKPFVFATGQNPASMVFGLPGNPVSAFLCTLRLAGRILTRLGGGEPSDIRSQAILATDLPGNGPREFYALGILAADRVVTPLASSGSADIFTMGKANAFIIRPENAPAATAGEIVEMIEF